MSHSTRTDRLVPAGLIALSLVPSGAGIARLAGLAGPVTPATARFAAAPLPIVLHVAAAIPFAVLGALQFAPGLRARGSGWHRAAGRALAPLGLAAALSGLWMTLSYAVPQVDQGAVRLLRLFFGSAMALSVVLGLNAVRRRDFAAHGAWMTRGYAIGLGAGTQVLTHLPWFILVGEVGPVSRPVLMGAAWVINLAVAERAIRRRAAAPPRRPPARSPAATGARDRRAAAGATAWTR